MRVLFSHSPGETIKDVFRLVQLFALPAAVTMDEALGLCRPIESVPV